MILTINEKDIEFKFGLKFLKRVDQIVGGDLAKFGMGLDQLLPALAMYTPQAVETILLASQASDKKLSLNEVDEFIENSDFEDLVEMITKEMEESNIIRPKMKKSKELMGQATK